MEELEKGDLAVLFSAPHCVDHLRDGKIKAHEINTDILIKKIKEKIDVSIIYKTESLNEDANLDENSNYKTKVLNFIKENHVKIFIDIHGMNYNREEDICIGTAFGKNLNGREDILNIMITKFKEAGYINTTVDVPFSASNKNCMSTFVAQRCKIPSFQIEINNKYRYPKSKEYDLEKLVSCFCDIIYNVSNNEKDI